MITMVTKHWLDRANTLVIYQFTQCAVNLLSHLLGQGMLLFIRLSMKEGHLPNLGLVRELQTLLPNGTRHTISYRAFEFVRQVAFHVDVAATTIK